MCEPTYRAFIGEWDDEDEADPFRTVRDARRLPWEAARRVLTSFARDILDVDDCPWCKGYAQDALAELEALEPGSEWAGDIEHDDLRLIRETA